MRGLRVEEVASEAGGNLAGLGLTGPLRERYFEEGDVWRLVANADPERALRGLHIDAEKAGESLAGAEIVLIRSSSNAGQLYGSVSVRDVVQGLEAAGHKVDKRQVVLGHPIKALGIHDVVGKSLGSTNPHNMVRATMNGLTSLVSVRQVARERGVEPDQIAYKSRQGA